MKEKIEFQWDSFPTLATEMLHGLYNSGNFSDVTLVCDDNIKFKAHGFVLSASSSKFKDILNNCPLQPFIYLRGITSRELEPIIDFIYLGEVTIEQDRLIFVHIVRVRKL